MLEFKNLLQRLQESPRITRSSLNQVPRQQGAYVLWMDKNPHVCLKVGIAGPRKDNGVRARLQFHFSSNPKNTILAEHMKENIDFGQAQGYDFQNRVQRQQFLANECFFQVLPLSFWSKEELKRLEDFLEFRLSPRYKGRVKKL